MGKVTRYLSSLIPIIAHNTIITSTIISIKNSNKKSDKCIHEETEEAKASQRVREDTGITTKNLYLEHITFSNQ